MKQIKFCHESFHKSFHENCYLKNFLHLQYQFVWPKFGIGSYSPKSEDLHLYNQAQISPRHEMAAISRIVRGILGEENIILRCCQCALLDTAAACR